MSGNVVGLRGAAVPGTREPDPDVVKRLRELLERAESGEIVGLVYGTVTPEAHFGTGWAGRGEKHAMMAATAFLFHRVMASEMDD